MSSTIFEKHEMYNTRHLQCASEDGERLSEG